LQQEFAMQMLIADVLTKEDLALLRAAFDKAQFVDGRETAGWAAKGVKQNQQAAAADPAFDPARERVAKRLAENALVQMAALPRQFTPVLFAQYGKGMTYGAHVDNAFMHGVRTDLSFTVFVDEPDAYDGGELVIESSAGEFPVKGAAGSAFLYASTTLHRVDPVTRGLRRVAVGWIQSRVRSAEQREILFDLDTARRNLFNASGKTAEFDLLSKCNANLMRMWAD
jgi:PKHD-type hydroxylase